jgi:hypothetical protein
MIDWNEYLHADERVLWEGRPAPRCHTLRYWRFSLVGAFMLMLLGGWQGAAVPMGAPQLPALILLSLAGCALVLLLGLPLRQRLAWETIFYAITDRQLLIAAGRRVAAMPLDTIAAVHLETQGEELGTLRLERSVGPPLTLSCLEYPRVPADLLKQAGHPTSET